MAPSHAPVATPAHYSAKAPPPQAATSNRTSPSAQGGYPEQ